MDHDKMVERMEFLGDRNRLLENRLSGIQKVAADLKPRNSVTQILHLLATQVTNMLEAERATIFLLNEDTGTLRSEVVVGPEVRKIELPIGRGIAGIVAANRKTINAKDAYKHPNFDPAFDKETGFRTRSILCQPILTYDNRIMGVVQVLNKKSGYFTTEDSDLLATVTTQATISIDNSRILQQLTERNIELDEAQLSLRENYETLNTLFALQGLMSHTYDRDQMFKDIIERLNHAIPSRCVAALVTSDVPVKLIYRQHGEPKARVVTGPASAGLLADVVETGNPMFVNDRIPSGAVLHPEITVNVRSLLAMPLEDTQGQRYGALALVNRANTMRFNESDEQLLRIVVGQIGDTLERIRQHEELTRSNNLALIGQALSGVVHDLKSPMNIILGHVQLMEVEESPEERSRHAKEIIKQFKHVQAMTQEVLAFSRGQTQLLKRPIYLQEFLAEMKELLEKEFDGLNIALEFKNHYKGKFKADEGKLKRLFFNIARNARDAMPEGGRFSVEIEEEDEFLVFRFTDTGQGIPSEIRDHLFQSFVTQGKEEGTGLGLAIVKKIVDQHSGTVDYTSRPGKGTQFVIAFPKEIQ